MNKDLAKTIIIVLFVGVCGVLLLYYFYGYLLIFLDSIGKEIPVIEFLVSRFYLVGLGFFCFSIVMVGTYEKILKKTLYTRLHYTLLCFFMVSFVLGLIIPTIARYSVEHVLSKKGYAQCLDEYPYTLGRIPVYYYSKDQSLCESGQFKD